MNKNLLVAAVLLVPVAAIPVVLFFRPKQDPINASRGSYPARRDAQTVVGGVPRPASDQSAPEEAKQYVQFVADAAKAGQRLVDRAGDVDPTTAVVLKKGQNSNVDAVIDAFETGVHPERLTPTQAATPFDSKSYSANPQAYLAVIEPGRVWQTAEPGRGVPVLMADGPRFHQLKSGESVRLKVRSEAGFPVSFTSFDLGAFGNKLPAITVVADENGVAEAVFTASAGTTGDSQVLAGSPVASGRVKFLIQIPLIESQE